MNQETKKEINDIIEEQQPKFISHTIQKILIKITITILNNTCLFFPNFIKDKITILANSLLRNLLIIIRTIETLWYLNKKLKTINERMRKIYIICCYRAFKYYLKNKNFIHLTERPLIQR